MRYLIAHLLEGEVGEFHRRITADLARRFGVEPLHEIIPPHITLKAPFDRDDPEDVAALLKKTAAARDPSPLRYEGFGHFPKDTRVIFLTPVASREAEETIELLRRNLRGIGGLSWESHEKKLRLHASVARFLSPRKFRKIMDYLANVPARFSSRLDNVALLGKAGRRWEVLRRFPLPGL